MEAWVRNDVMTALLPLADHGGVRVAIARGPRPSVQPAEGGGQARVSRPARRVTKHLGGLVPLSSPRAGSDRTSEALGVARALD